MWKLWKQYNADVAMMYLMVIWGLHYIVVKDAVTYFDGLTFNAIRFVLGTIIMIPIGFRFRKILAVWEWRDLRYLVFITLCGSVLYQILFVTSLRYTTATNTALLGSTMPMWTAIISIILGTIILKRSLIIGLVMTLLGVVLVILSREGESLSIAHHDLIGDSLALAAAFVLGAFWIASKPLIDKYGSLSNAIYKHWITAFGLVMVSLPNLLKTSPSDIPPSIIPNILFSGLVASISGYLISNYAIGKMGAARTSTYNNFSPIIAAVAGILFLHEPLTAGILIGAALTLIGVAIVRRYMQTRQPPQRRLQWWQASLSTATGD